MKKEIPKELTTVMQPPAELVNALKERGRYAPYDGEHKEFREEVWIGDDKEGWLERNVEVTVYTHQDHSVYYDWCED
jgi:hypothetical protein